MNQTGVTCPPGTKEQVVNCITAPCPPICVDEQGNVVPPISGDVINTGDEGVVTTITTTGLTTTQKWVAVIALTAVAYYILYKAGSFK